MSYSLIAAIGREREIGVNNKIPWRLPEDLKRFKELTTGHTVIMGRETYESIGKPLPNRRNIVISRKLDFNPQGLEVAKSIEEALSLAQGNGEVFIIGGAEIYNQTLPLANKMYLTTVDVSVPTADSYFPSYNVGDWKVALTLPCPPSETNPLNSVYTVYERRK